MKLVPTNCPSCNSMQRFAPKKRVASGMIQTYIVCRACGWENLISARTVSHERKERLMRRRRNSMMGRRR